MSEQASPFSAVDDYLTGLFVGTDAALDAALDAMESAGLPQIQVSPIQGRLLYVLARLCRARRILEIGTLGGYSTIWLARALEPGGHLVTLELDPKHADVARKNLERAGLADRCRIALGDAQQSLQRIIADGAEPFDMVFIDADKENYPAYLEAAIHLTRPGGLIAADNVVRGGKVIDPSQNDPLILGVRKFNELVAADPRVDAVIFQQVGSKVHDGLALAVVK